MLEQSIIGLKNKGGILMVLDKVKEIIIEQLGLDEDVEITMETSLMNDLEADSLDAVEVIMAIEDEFDIEIPDEDAEDFKNIGDIVKYVEDRI
jgi:acyl carrier protein